jgi:hypothetical protein
MKFIMRDTGLAAMLALLLVAPLGSATARDAGATPGDFGACAGVDDPAARLACYDVAAGRTIVAPGQESAASPAAPAPQAAAPSATAGPPPAVAASSAEEKFGDTGQLRVDAEARRQIPSKLESRVKRVVNLPNGRYLLTLDNEQVWQTTDANWAVDFKPQDAITISRLPLGGYQIAHVHENRTLGVKRTQ